jgi:murein DD-endopeptidase MepM/ murein hydrolase activator NlpD
VAPLLLCRARVASTSLFNVLIVRGDGGSIRRFRMTRWLVIAATIASAVALTANAVLLVDYVSIRRQHVAVSATRDRLEQRARVLEPMERRLVELRDEMTTWDSLHAAILSPLARDRRSPAGIGGPSRTLSNLDLFDVLLLYVRDESQRLRALARVTREAGGILAALPSRLPLNGAINSGFGLRRSPWTGAPEFHGGIDLAAAAGTPVKAGASGLVRFAGRAGGYGNVVILDHGRGIESRYGHLHSIDVVRGQRVERDQRIGLTGNTGRSTAPHLHYEVLVAGQPVDPRQLSRD